jgi:Tol biopolymer transport system component
MAIFGLFTFAKKMRVSCLPVQSCVYRANASYLLLAVILLFGLVTGCGGNSKTPVSTETIAFASSAPVDGSTGFSGPAANVWVANADGSDSMPLTRMTAGGADVDNVIWSPDGSKIAFISSRALDGSDAVNTNSTFNLWVMNAGGSGALPLTRLTATSGQGVLDLAWSPNGRQITYDSNRALDGSDAVSPNQRSNVWIVNIDGTGGAPLTHLTAADASSPQWSPDGSKITFTSSGALNGSDAGFMANVWVMNADGSSATPVTTFANTFSTHSAFSPDGTKLAFTSNRTLDGSDVATGASNIWVSRANGFQAIPLTKYTDIQVGSIFGGIWSPDGKKLAFEFTAALDGSDTPNINITRNVWVANADGSGATPLTRLAYSTVSAFGAIPTGWSPDNTRVTFTSDQALDNSSTASFLNAWTVDADGSNPIPLTKVGGTSPVWKP